MTEQLIGTDEYWNRTSKLVGGVLVVWAVISMVLPALVNQLNNLVFLTFPLGFYLAAQGILVGFVWLIFYYNRNQNLIDDMAVSQVKDDVDIFASSVFMKKLNKVYGTYAGGFLCFVLLMAAFEAGGVSDRTIGYLFVVFTITIYAGIGLLARTSKATEYYVAGHKVPGVYNGMATAADWMSGASFVGMAGKLYYGGYNSLAFVVGWTGGYVIVATLIAPFLRKFKAYTVPDFLAARYDGMVDTPFGGEVNTGQVTRVMGIIILFCASFSYLTAQVYSTGIIMSRFLDIGFEYTCYIGLGGILLCSMLGGMRGVTWTQVAQYIVLIVAYNLPVFWMSIQTKKAIIPQLDYGNVLEDVVAREQEMLTECYNYGVNQTYQCLVDSFPAELSVSYTMNGTIDTPTRLVDWWALTVCLMLGTASLPHVLMRYFTTPSVKVARKSVGWSLFFIFFLYVTAPTYATFAKNNIYQNIIGSPVSDLPDWVFIYGEVGLVMVCAVAPSNVDEAIAACAEIGYAESDPLRLVDFWMDTDAVVLATPEANNLPYTISALTAAGGLAASLSTADGLLLAMANSLSHDIYYKMINPNASSFRRVTVSRVFLIIIALVCAYVATTKPADILSMVAWAFSLAAAGNFPALFLGVWWKRANGLGVIAGMLTGFPITLFYIVGNVYMDWELWGGVANISAAIFGLPIGFFVTIVVSLLTAPPSQEIQDFVVSLREPEDPAQMNSQDENEDENQLEMYGKGVGIQSDV